jgi:hypothetical protein
MALDQIVAVLLCEDGKVVVEIDGGSERRIVLKIPTVLLTGRALRCHLVVHRLGVDHGICRVFARECRECLSLEPCFEEKTGFE